jgi:tRNA pseudouridine55 synthase
MTRLFGLLNINKPRGVTSRDVVNHVQAIVRPERVGHAGTLDPLATGVLVVCLGAATRLVEHVQRQRKQYRAAFLLGRTSDTEDVTGNVAALTSPPVPAREEIAAVLPRFVGTIEQVPPAFSALKLAGRRAYDVARAGGTVELAPRRVEVHDIALRDYQYPSLCLDIVCGSGTYVRSLGRDIARALGTEAVMAELQRTAIGAFCVADACELADLRGDSLEAHLLPAARAVADLPAIVLDSGELRELSFGRPVRDRWQVAGAELAALDAGGGLAAILAPGQPGWLRPLRTLVCTPGPP